MTTRSYAPAVLLLGIVLCSRPASGGVWEAKWSEEERVCTVGPPGYGMVLSMREDAGQRQAQVFVHARLEAGGVVYLRIDEGRVHTSKQNYFSGAEAQSILNELWTGEFLEIGHSRGLRPIRVTERLRIAGLQEAVNTCTRSLGWDRSEPAKSAPEPNAELPTRSALPTPPAPAEPPGAGGPGNEAPASIGCDIAEKLRSLGDLRSDDLLTDEEFTDLKQRLLDRCREELGQVDDSSFEAGTVSPQPSAHEDPGDGERPWELDPEPVASRLAGYSGLAPRRRPAIAYENRWTNGTAFVVGSTDDLQLWVAFTIGRDPQALVYVVNASDRRITFSPESITATAVRTTREGVTRASVKAFSAADYEKKVRNKQAWQAALYGAAAAMANQPQPQHGTFSGGYSAYRPYQPGAQVVGSFYGQITRWPTAADYAAARERTGAQIQAMGDQLRASFDAMSATLMRTHTLETGSYYGGVVHFSRFRGERISLAIPLDGHLFQVDFTLP